MNEAMVKLVEEGYTCAWYLGHEKAPETAELPPGYAEVSVEPLLVEPMSPGQYLMEVCLKQDELPQGGETTTIVYLPQVLSRPHSTLWSNATFARETRAFVDAHRPVWSF